MLVKQLGIDIDKPIEEMKREEILFALARECRAEHYQRIVTWHINILRSLLRFYQTSVPHEIFMGIDFAGGPDDHVVVERVGHPASRSYKKGESMWFQLPTPQCVGSIYHCLVATAKKLHINPTPSRDRLIFIQHPMDAKGEMRIQRKMVFRGAPILVPKGGDVYDGETGELIVKNPIR